MSDYYRHRLRQLQKLLEPGLRRMLFLSFLLHLIVPVILSGILETTHRTPKVPVYRVNLVNKPVKDPQAGRPDAVPVKKKKKKPVKKKVAVKKIPTKKSKAVKTAPVKKKRAPVVKKKVPTKSTKPDKTAETALQKRLAEMQAQAKRDADMAALRAKLAAQKAELGKPDVKAPVGEPDGTGKEIGISDVRYVENFIKQNWRLSQYQLPNLDLQVEVRVYYSKDGKQGKWEVVEKSGNVFFDNSVKNAILLSKNLDYSLPTAGTFEIIFNLKDLQKR